MEHFGLRRIEDLPSIDDIKLLVENSVNKEELIGTTKMVDVPQEVPRDGAPDSERPEPKEPIACEGQDETESNTQENR